MMKMSYDTGLLLEDANNSRDPLKEQLLLWERHVLCKQIHANNEEMADERKNVKLHDVNREVPAPLIVFNVAAPITASLALFKNSVSFTFFNVKTLGACLSI